MARRKNPAAVALGRKGGKVTSEKKARAARRNGKKGGRPRKEKDVDAAASDDDWRQESLRRRAQWDGPLERMLARGWPLTKAVWLFEANLGEPPDFPLHPERKAQIPRELEGRVPRSLSDFYELLGPLGQREADRERYARAWRRVRRATRTTSSS